MQRNDRWAMPADHDVQGGALDRDLFRLEEGGEWLYFCEGGQGQGHGQRRIRNEFEQD